VSGTATQQSVAPETAAPSTPDSAPSPAPASTSSSPSQQSTPTPASSGESKGESKQSLLDAVLKAVPTAPEPDVLRREDTSGAPTPQTPTSQEQAQDATDKPDDDTADDEPAPAEASPLVRKKINKLLKQRRELRDHVTQITPVAQIGHELQTFANVNELTGDDIIRALNIAATLRRGDYDAFYKEVGPYVRRAQEYLGVVLPPDLHMRVQQGQMTQEAAMEFARTRFDHQRAEQAVAGAREAQVSQHVQHLQTNVQRAVSGLEERFAASDPDYRQKADHVKRTAQAMLFERGGSISSVDEALQLTKAAYDEVNARLRRLQPMPRATGVLPNGHGQTSTARPQPKTLMEAALQGLQNARSNG
jgi:hypothetical protein